MRFLILGVLAVCFVGNTNAGSTKLFCNSNEVFSRCLPDCQDTCLNYKKGCSTPYYNRQDSSAACDRSDESHSHYATCRKGCICKSGYVRRVATGECLKIKYCRREPEESRYSSEEYYESGYDKPTPIITVQPVTIEPAQSYPSRPAQSNPNKLSTIKKYPGFLQSIVLGGQSNNNQNAEGQHSIAQFPGHIGAIKYATYYSSEETNEDHDSSRPIRPLMTTHRPAPASGESESYYASHPVKPVGTHYSNEESHYSNQGGYPLVTDAISSGELSGSQIFAIGGQLNDNLNILLHKKRVSKVTPEPNHSGPKPSNGTSHY